MPSPAAARRCPPSIPPPNPRKNPGANSSLNTPGVWVETKYSASSCQLRPGGPRRDVALRRLQFNFFLAPKRADQDGFKKKRNCSSRRKEALTHSEFRIPHLI